MKAMEKVTYLKTWEFGKIRIVKTVSMFDTYIRNDMMDDWEYYQLANGTGEIVAMPTPENPEYDELMSN